MERGFRGAPQPWYEDSSTVNVPFREWLTGTFGVTVPATALEIVREPVELGDRETIEPVCRWASRLQEERWPQRSP